MNNNSLPSLWWAGLLTVGLVWFVGAYGLPDTLAWIDERLQVHISAACFLTLSLLLRTQSSAAIKIINLSLQAICAAAFIAVDRSSSGPILNIVLVSQIPYVLGIRPAVIAAVVVSLVHFFILIVIKEYEALSAFVSMALFACFQLFSLMVGHFAIQAHKARNDLAATNAELLATRSLLESSARDRERLRVSRELHDTAGHTLTALKLNLRELRDRSAPGDREALSDCLNLSSELLEDIRDLVGNLREHDSLDLQAALEKLTHPFNEPLFSIQVADDVAIDDLALAEDLLAVARESITNVVRHAQATQCTISVFRGGDRVCLTVSDDGVGGIAEHEGFGIQGMRERLSVGRGEFTIGPNETRGTRVAATWACA